MSITALFNSCFPFTVQTTSSFTSLQKQLLLRSSHCLKVKVKSLSCVPLFATPWTVAYQAPPTMRFFKQESWSGLPFPSSRGSSWPRDRTQVSCTAGRRFNLWPTREAHIVYHSTVAASWSILFSFWHHIGCSMQLVGFQFPKQELNPGPRQWDHSILTTGLPGTFLWPHIFLKSFSAPSHSALLTSPPPCPTYKCGGSSLGLSLSVSLSFSPLSFGDFTIFFF